MSETSTPEGFEARKMLVGKAALTVVRHRDGTRSNIPAGRAVPRSVDRLDAERLLDEGFLEEIEVLAPVVDPEEAVAEAAAADPVDDFPTWADKPRPDGWEDFSDEEKMGYVYGTGDPDADADSADAEGMTDEEIDTLLAGSAADVMDRVGDNADLARRVLAAEADGQNRKGLTADLESVAGDTK